MAMRTMGQLKPPAHESSHNYPLLSEKVSKKTLNRRDYGNEPR